MNIFVARLSSETTGEDLQNLFAHYGEVAFAKVIIDRETGNSKRYGFVEMPNSNEANEAIGELNESEFQGSTIVCKESAPREPRDDRRGGGGGGYRRDDNRGGGGYRRDDNRGGGYRDYNRGGDSDYGRRDSNRRFDKRY